MKGFKGFLFTKVMPAIGGRLGMHMPMQHRLVDMFTAHELTRSLAHAAAAALANTGAAGAARAVTAAKVQVGKAGRFVGQQAIQLHGGMGMTDEMAIGHYFKRLTMIDKMFGDTDYHLARFADL